MDSYWNKVLSRRIGRRRALLTAGGAAGAAAFLAACGGDDDNTSSGTGTSSTGAGTTSPGASGSGLSSLITTPVDETKSAVKGGVFKTRNTFEPSASIRISSLTTSTSRRPIATFG